MELCVYEHRVSSSSVVTETVVPCLHESSVTSRCGLLARLFLSPLGAIASSYDVYSVASLCKFSLMYIAVSPFCSSSLLTYR